MPVIHFLDEERWDGGQHAVTFHAQVEGSDQLIICLVPSEMLRDRFKAPRVEREILLRTFREHRSEIEEIATRLIESQRYEPDGTVVIRKDDA